MSRSPSVAPDLARRRVHDDILSNLPRPSWLRSSSLLDDEWSIRTEDAELKRRGERRVYFDVVVAQGGIRSTHPALENDLITAKIVAYECQRPRTAGGITNGSAFTPQVVAQYFHFVRWRLSRGVRSNAELTMEWIDDFISTLRERGPMGLLPLEQRVDRLIAAYRETGASYPFEEDRYGPPRLRMELLANELGLQSALSIPEDLRERLGSAAGCPRYSARLAEPTSRPGKRTVAADGSYSASRLHVLLRPLELLYRYRERLGHDPIEFDPFPHGRSTWQVARSLASREEMRTPTIPAMQACHLINQALVWISTYSDDLLEVAAQLGSVGSTAASASARHRQLVRTLAAFEPRSMSTAAGSPWRLLKPDGGTSSVSQVYRLAIFDLLPAAAMIVIAAFSARRWEEIDSLRADCIETVGEDHWMETWISKTLQSTAKIPVPSSVVRAIRVLETLSALQRERSGKAWLFDFYEEAFSLRRAFDARTAIRRFSEFVDVPPLPNGDEWWFAPHQFRRFFGIVYYHHYRFPHLVALSHFYRHFDPDMTRVYISEVRPGEFLRNSELRNARSTPLERKLGLAERERLSDFMACALEFRVERYAAIARGEERASGWGGEVLSRELNELVANVRAQIEVVGTTAGTSRLNEAIEAFASSRRLEPNPLGHSYCKCESHEVDLKAAECLKQGGTRGTGAMQAAPDPRYASDMTCSACPHNVQLEENRQYWMDLIEHERTQAGCAMGPLLRALAEQRLADAERHAARCFQ